jgi:hypothetical protein
VQQGNKIMDLLDQQKRDPMLLETDQVMIDKMGQDHLYFSSRLSQMLTTSVPRETMLSEIQELQKSMQRGEVKRDRDAERLKIMISRLAQLDKRADLIYSVEGEIRALEERMLFVLDALSFQGHKGFDERLYIPSPLLVELQTMVWTTDSAV